MTFKISIKNGGFNFKTTLKIMSKTSQCLKNWILKILNDSSFSINFFWHRIRKNNFLKIRKAKHVYYLTQNTIIYFRLLGFMKLPKFSCCPWKWIPAEPDNFWYRPHDMINLFNFGIKTVVHIVIKYDNSQIKMKKKSVKLPKTSTAR